jgi:type VI secretion system secreted protein Hcp
MPSDYLLDIDGIPGESKDSKYPNAIEIRSYSWGANNPGSGAHGSGSGAGKVHFEDMNFSASVSKASPLLALACATGQHIRKARLIIRKQGDQQQDYMVITLEDLIVSEYQSADAGPMDLVPLDDFSLNFAKIKFQYRVQNNTGGLDPAITTGWDLKENKKQ